MNKLTGRNIYLIQRKSKKVQNESSIPQGHDKVNTLSNKEVLNILPYS